MNTNRLLTGSCLGGCLLSVILVASACSETEDVTPDPAGPVLPTSGGAAGSGPPPAWACPQGTSGAKLVLIPTPDGGGYCIDERETTYAEYKAFLGARAEDTSGQPADCAWNDSFLPELDSEIRGCSPGDWQFETQPDRPVNCVDICDAWSYCHWAGKRLCGVRGADPGKLNEFGTDEFPEVATSTESEWFNVCSQGGQTKYPYGDTYEPGTCIDQAKVEAEGNAALNVADTSGSTCHGSESPYDQVHNMSGSVKTWLNICCPDGCATQGGAYYRNDNPERLACATSLGAAPRRYQNFAMSIRCCSDAVAAPKAE